MTEAELATERLYRVTERLGLLVGASEPTPEQKALARAEADAWEREWQSKHEPEVVDNAPM
jgi:hypothetical protein